MRRSSPQNLNLLRSRCKVIDVKLNETAHPSDFLSGMSDKKYRSFDEVAGVGG